ncbi:MAG: hypothetical protein GKR77_00975 [Legionellales bacterium]|nr:hypothetical protein [Legionellales bacterium]
MQRFFSAFQRTPKKVPQPRVDPNSFRIRHVTPRFGREAAALYNPEALNTAYQRARRQLSLVTFLASTKISEQPNKPFSEPSSEFFHTQYTCLSEPSSEPSEQLSEPSSEFFNALHTYLTVASTLGIARQFKELGMAKQPFVKQIQLLAKAMTKDKPSNNDARNKLNRMTWMQSGTFTDHCDAKSLGIFAEVFSNERLKELALKMKAVEEKSLVKKNHKQQESDPIEEKLRLTSI